MAALKPHSLARPRKIFLGWWVVLAGLSIQGLNSTLLGQAFGAYFVHLKREFGWSSTVLSGSFSLMQLLGGVLGPLQGRLVDRLGPKAIASFGVVTFAIGFVLFSFVHSKLAFYGAFFVMALGVTFAGWIPLSVAAAGWFRRKRAMAMGIITAGGSLGGFTVPAIAWSLNHLGWRGTAIGSAGVLLFVSLPLTLLLRRRPEDYGLRPDGAPGPAIVTGQTKTQPTAVLDDQDFTAAQAMRTSAFWLIGIGHAAALLIVGAVNVHLIAHLVQRLGMSVEKASAMLAIMTVFSILGQIVASVVADRVEKRLMASVAMTGHILGVIALAFAPSVAWVVLFCVLHGSAWGLRGPLMGAIRADYFGHSHLGAILGFSSLILMVGALSGPLLAGILADATGDYRLGFVIIGVLGGIGSLAFVLARKPARIKPSTALAAAPERQ